MRLLNTQTIKLEEFVNLETVQYSILSHRWESEEVSFRDLQTNPDVVHKRGYTKIQNACELAAGQGYKYIWIDTCCIDKDSSAELSEAINSMFHWYRTASVCYAYLSDVLQHPLHVPEFKASLWFTRGWTLQELLAPELVAFYDCRWNFLGLKHELIEPIADATGIDKDALKDAADVFKFAISERMSWASKRKTTRIEDSAYSLMGIFNVNMPMLYGEGSKAFIRLQEEIIKHSDDQTIFAWSSVAANHGGLLAPSVQCFADIPLFEPLLSSSDEESHNYLFTNTGLAISLELRPWDPYVYFARLRCRKKSSLNGDVVGIFLQKIAGKRQYLRVSLEAPSQDLLVTGGSLNLQSWFRLVKVNVPQPDLAVTLAAEMRSSMLNRPSLQFRLLDHTTNVGRSLYYDDSGMLKAERTVAIYHLRPLNSKRASGSGRVAQADLTWLDAELGYILLGFDFNFMPVCVISYKKTHKPGNFFDLFTEKSVHEKSLTDISCFEPLGWSVMSTDQTGTCNDCYVGDRGLWTMKCSGLWNIWRCCVKMQEKDGRSEDRTLCYVTIEADSDFCGWTVKLSKGDSVLVF